MYVTYIIAFSCAIFFENTIPHKGFIIDIAYEDTRKILYVTYYSILYILYATFFKNMILDWNIRSIFILVLY